MAETSAKFVSRAGDKLQGALDAMGLDVRGFVCADFGCNVGGFTDCLLQRGARKVYAIDTGYGELAWRLRKDARVVVMERTNALYCDVTELVDLVVVDVAWTPQAMAVPAALRWLKPGGQIISLLKPHYELAKQLGHAPREGLSPQQTRQIVLDTCEALGRHGAQVQAVMRSVLLGKGGNEEFLLNIRPASF